MSTKPTYEELEQRIQSLEQAEFKQRRMNEDLPESENWNQSIIQKIQAAVVVHDADTKIIMSNFKAQELLGLAEDQMIGKAAFDSNWKFLRPDSKELPLCEYPINQVLETKKPLRSFPCGIRRASKLDLLWVLVSADPVLNDKGEIQQVIVTFVDITERKEAQDIINEQATTLNNILEKAADGICVCYNIPEEPYVRFTHWNPRMTDITGFHIDEINKLGWYQTIYPNPEVRKQAIERMTRMREEKNLFSEEWVIATKYGEEKHLSISTSVVKKTEGEVHVLAIMKDISERRKAEEALRKSEEKYRNILESIEDVYAEIDLAGNFTFFNQSLCQISGYTTDEMMGSNNQQYLDEKNAKRMYRFFNTVFKTGITAKLTEVEFFKKDGSTCTLEILVSLVKGEDDKPAGFRGIARDITERKKAEEEKAKLEYQLRQVQKMETIGTIAGGVAHDLNNILSGIVGYPDLLLLQLPEDSPLRKPILNIQESGKKAAAIVQDLLTLTRRGVLNCHVLNFNKVISEYLESPEFNKLKSFYPDVDVETNLESGLLNIFGSPIHLSKIVMNLVSNSAEAISEKGKVSIATENRYIDSPIRGYETVEEGDYIALTVSDTGTGISPGDIARIFDPFYTKKKMGKSGTGLGMSVVWGTLKDHKGYIDVQSTEGKGTTFRLYFPVTRQELTQDQVDFSIENYMGTGQSVLVVDDVKEQRDLVSAMLNILGYSVATASSGEKAVEYLQNNSADLLILDMIMLPGIDGLDTYRQILKFHPGQKAIIASGYSETDRVKEAQNLGSGQYIKKPYTLEKIGLAVKKELDK